MDMTTAVPAPQAFQDATLTLVKYDTGNPVTVAEDAEANNIAVAALSAAMLQKLNTSFKAGRAGWNRRSECPVLRLITLFNRAVAHGDVVDIANYSMMLFARGVRNLHQLQLEAERLHLSHQITELAEIEERLRSIRNDVNVDPTTASYLSEQIDSLSGIQLDLTTKWNELSRDIKKGT